MGVDILTRIHSSRLICEACFMTILVGEARTACWES
jgi:hypothetical protein